MLSCFPLHNVNFKVRNSLQTKDDFWCLFFAHKSLLQQSTEQLTLVVVESSAYSLCTTVIQVWIPLKSTYYPILFEKKENKKEAGNEPFKLKICYTECNLIVKQVHPYLTFLCRTYILYR